MNIIEFVVGDASGDGHGRSRNFVMESNLTKQEVTEAYIKGARTIGFDLTLEVAKGYEDEWLWRRDYDKLKAHGYEGCLNNEEDFEDESTTAIALIDAEEFFDIFCFFIKIGNPSFVCVPAQVTKYNIGGYGILR